MGLITGFRILSFLTGVSDGLTGGVEVCLSLWEPSWDGVSCVIIDGNREELGLGGEIGSFILPWAICCAHFASKRDLDLEPGGLPTEKKVILNIAKCCFFRFVGYHMLNNDCLGWDRCRLFKSFYSAI